MDEQINDDLYRLALDYRSAAPGDARDKWLELEAFVAGLVAKGDQWKHDAINGSNYLREKLAAVEAERDALKAELERIRAMKPSAYWCDGEYFDTEEEAQNFCDKEAQLSETITPLYSLEKKP